MSTLQENELQDSIRRYLKTYNDFPKPGVRFKDIQSLLMFPDINRMVIESMHASFKNNNLKPDVILAFDARGFLYGGMYAFLYGIPLIMARKKGKLPGELVTQVFEKEYGQDEISVQKGLIKPDMKVLIHDDLLATGGTSEAAAKIVIDQGGIIEGFHFLIELEYLGGRNILEQFNSQIISTVSFVNPQD